MSDSPEPSKPGEPSEVKLAPNAPALWSKAGEIVTHPSEGIFGQKDIPSVFNKLVHTVTGKNAYEIDRAEQDFKLLSADGIATNTGMKGLKSGSGQNHITGNYVFQVDGDRLGLINGDDSLKVTGAQTEHIAGNAIFLYDKSRKVVVRLDYDLSVAGDSTRFVFGKSSEQFVGQHEVTAPEEFEWKQMERGFSAMKLDMATFGLDIHAMSADVHVVDAEATVMEGKGGTFHEIIEGQRMNLIALILATAMRLDIMLRADALIDVGTGTPFR
jgi:hypothetical protein